MGNEITIPKPTVIPQVFDDEGRRVVRPDVLNFVILSSIAAHTAKTSKAAQALHDHAKDLEGEGLTRRLDLSISDNLEKLYLPEKWQSFTLTNDGANTVKVWVNSLYTQDITVKAFEALNYDTKTHKIKKLYLQCSSGESASIRITGSY